NSSDFFNKNDIMLPNNLWHFNTEAPAETKQFAFMIGKFVCNDSLLVGGQWVESKAAWEAHYILNGFGVRDVYRNNQYAGESIRFYNSSKGKWDVYFFGMLGEHTGLWEGEYIDGKMVMKQERTGPNGEKLLSQITFYNITDDGFDWKGELIHPDTGKTTVNWKIKAKWNGNKGNQH
ncbi:MAG: hypothetical protein OEW87_03130, partial [Flavobacteriaceae bacterium]|nr:hypothetical protein [Flavobacteriaceae bacterium]